MDVDEATREDARQKCLALSQDTRTFLVDPPSGTDFAFNASMLPSAMATLRADDELQKKRFELVPGKVSEQVRRGYRGFIYTERRFGLIISIV